MFSYLSETWCPVYPRAMNEQGMEEHCVSLLHDKVNLGNLLILIKQPMEKFVGFTLGKKEKAWTEITQLKLKQVLILRAQ